MLTVSTIAEARAWRRSVAGSLGLVPTMGYLHAGHLSLVQQARASNDAVAASVFVNPTQFGPREDLSRYPRDVARDSRLLGESGCDMLFLPSAEEMYPSRFETTIDVGSVAAPLEGARRPGHFRGVATVVAKLFAILEPTRAYFGEKDAQQLAVIERMALDLDIPVEVKPCPIVREEDGLALSSRNVYLSPEERRAAPVLYRALCAARMRWEGGERDADALRGAMRAVLDLEPRAEVDYAAVAEPETFREAAGQLSDPVLLLLAVKVGTTRLIDNLRLAP